MRNPLSPAASARTTRPTSARYPPGGPAYIPGNPAGVTNQAQGDAPADNRLLHACRPVGKLPRIRLLGSSVNIDNMPPGLIERWGLHLRHLFPSLLRTCRNG